MNLPAGWKTRELEILQLLAEGLTNGEVGARLHLAPDTVRWYNKQIFAKLGISNRLQAVNRASELGLLRGAEGLSAAAVPPTRPPVGYVTNGEVHIAYQVVGQGPVDLLFIHGFLSHLELAWENPEFASFFEHVGRFARVILFDKRGVGLSDRIQGAPTLETTIEDARRVLDAAGSKHAFVMGTSEGGAAAVLLAATYPERVLGLILYGALPTVVQIAGEPAWATPEDRFERMLENMQQSWGGPWAVEGFAPSRSGDETFRAWWAMILRSSASPASVKAVLTQLRQIDIRALLPQVRIKTLVVHKTHDRITPVEAGRYFAIHMPNATWVELQGADHIYFIESAGLLTALAQFCRAPADLTSVDTWIAIILYARANSGAVSPADLQRQISGCQPRHNLSAPDGRVALFDSPSRAIQCALQLREYVPAYGFRIGLHVGECSLADGRPLAPVLESARLAVSLAAPSEIVVTRTLRDILAGSGYVFEARQTEGGTPQSLTLYTLA